MSRAADYRPHRVQREDRLDGSIILRSGYDMGAVDSTIGSWIDRFSEQSPDAVFLAERSGAGWREITYQETWQSVRAIAASLLDRGLGPQTPILILSGNSVDHGLLALAAQYVGIPIVPLAEQYSLIPAAHPQLIHCAALVKPHLIFAEDGERFGKALALSIFDGLEKVSSAKVGKQETPFTTLLRGGDANKVDRAAASVSPDTVAKYLMTSGSTSNPKGVITTHRMMCANQTQIADALTFLKDRPPVIIDWLPWNHVFGGSHNFNLMLANGGSLYIDGGKPIKQLVGKTIENLRLKSGTLSFNVPLGFAMIRDALRDNAELRRRYFKDLDMIFYAGASLPQDVWADLESMARDVRGDAPLMISSWGMTETAPACLIVHEPIETSGIVGVPMTGLEIKLVPDDEMRCDLRVRGPNVTPGYLNDSAKTAELFDEEGFLISGDAVRFVDATKPERGLRFDGRVSEDFKLSSGTWVRSANLRLALLPRLASLAQDIVICGADRMEVGLMIFPSPEAISIADGQTVDGAFISPALQAAIKSRFENQDDQGSATKVSRIIVLAEPPQMGDGEITAKGNLNFVKIITRRSALLKRLYDDHDPAVIRL
ncbi:MAG: feruloyl-CoA synthase [Pseudomonadota bacterium]